MYIFEDWHKTAWDKINVETLVEETKKLAKEVKTLNKAVSTLSWLEARAGVCLRASFLPPLGTAGRQRREFG